MMHEAPPELRCLTVRQDRSIDSARWLLSGPGQLVATLAACQSAGGRPAFNAIQLLQKLFTKLKFEWLTCAMPCQLRK
jgi:hypothetical protein